MWRSAGRWNLGSNGLRIPRDVCICTVYISMSARISSSVVGVTVVFSGREDNHQRMYESTEIVELPISSVLSLMSTGSCHRHWWRVIERLIRPRYLKYGWTEATRSPVATIATRQCSRQLKVFKQEFTIYKASDPTSKRKSELNDFAIRTITATRSTCTACDTGDDFNYTLVCPYFKNERKN